VAHSKNILVRQFSRQCDLTWAFLLQSMIDAASPNALMAADKFTANACLCFGFFAFDVALTIEGQASLANDHSKQPHVGLNLLPHRFRHTGAGLEAHGV
jgi:hypothetical protein